VELGDWLVETSLGISMAGSRARHRQNLQGNTRAIKRNPLMPVTKKGQKILRAMRKQYGSRKGTSVFYASANKGRIRGVHRARRGK
jgi:hypothetical protein